MKILQSGVPKCGNFWLYQIIQQILERSGYDTKSYIEQHPIYALAKNWELNFPDQNRIDVLEITDLQYRFRISSIFNMPIDDIEAYVKKANHVWTHSPVCKRSREVFQLFDKKIYIIRDPRDRALSAAKYYCSDYMKKYFPQPESDPDRFLEQNFEKLMKEWVWHVWDHLRLSHEHNIHIAFFEGFNTNFQKELNLLLNYLGIEFSDAQKAELQHATSFEKLKAKNAKHLKKGESGYWTTKLNDSQIESARIIAGPLMQHLGYPFEKDELVRFTRKHINSDVERLKQALQESQGALN